MINWYYVQGSDRVGPVSEESLLDLYRKDVINLESYIWRKGFVNWERLKDVAELSFSKTEAVVAPIKQEAKPERKQERKQDKKIEQQEEVEAVTEAESSPEIIFNFDWKAIGEEDEMFFIKVGTDRLQKLDNELFGPYSLHELKDALDEKRINNHTLIFAAGMPGWVEIGETPLDPKVLKLNTANIHDEAPLLIVVKHDPLPLIALVQVAGIKNCTLLGAGPFKAGTKVLGSIYSGTALKAKNLKLTIENYDPREQKVFCSIQEINDSGKKIMQNYAN